MLMLMLAAIVAVTGLRGAEAKTRDDGAVRAVEVIPEPRELTFSGDGFPSANARVIRVTDTAEDCFAAEMLRDALRVVCGVDCSIEPLAAGVPGAHELILAGAGSSAPQTPVYPASPASHTSPALDSSVCQRHTGTNHRLK